MRKLIYVLITFSLLLFSFTLKNNYTYYKKSGSYHYSCANYTSEFFIQKKYSLIFDSILHDTIQNFFRNGNISNLPLKRTNLRPKRRRHDTLDISVSIEPFFINTNSLDGLYGERHWKNGGANIRLKCGYIHYLFIISNNTYIALTEDSIANEALIRSNLSNSFNEKEINSMLNWGIKYPFFCNHSTFMMPVIIKNDSLTLWDAFEENKKVLKQK